MTADLTHEIRTPTADLPRVRGAGPIRLPTRVPRCGADRDNSVATRQRLP
jgi:hypothetical protein